MFIQYLFANSHEPLIQRGGLCSCCAGGPAPFAMARFAAGACRHALRRYRPCAALVPAAGRGLAGRQPGRAPAAAARHRRDAPAAPGPASLRRTPHRPAAATPSAPGPGAGRAGAAAFAAAVAAHRAWRRRTVGGRAGAAQWQLRRAAVLGQPCARRKPAPPAPGGPGRRNLVLHAASAGRRARRLAGPAAPGAAPGGGWLAHRFPQAPWTAARGAPVPAAWPAPYFFSLATTCVCGSACTCPS